VILSNTELQRALADGSIGIDPKPEPLKKIEGGVDCPYQTTAVDLRLSEEILQPADDAPITVDLRRRKFSELATAFYRPFTLTDKQPFSLAPGEFVLGRTVETVRLPIPADDSSPCFAARIEGRSSYARCGMTVHLTAPTIHAGYDGVITLEICNFGRYIISLYPRMYVCQLIVEQVVGRPFKNDSQFQGQTGANGTRAEF
jgi:dCTP deaminase